MLTVLHTTPVFLWGSNMLPKVFFLKRKEFLKKGSMDSPPWRFWSKTTHEKHQQRNQACVLRDSNKLTLIADEIFALCLKEDDLKMQFYSRFYTFLCEMNALSLISCVNLHHRVQMHLLGWDFFGSLPHIIWCGDIIGHVEVDVFVTWGWVEARLPHI